MGVTMIMRTGQGRIGKGLPLELLVTAIHVC
jgi:hypothetical protein